MDLTRHGVQFLYLSSWLPLSPEPILAYARSLVANGPADSTLRPCFAGFIAAYAGDTFWALAAFLGIGLILPRASTRTVAILAMAFSVAVELSQLYHDPWIDSIWHTTLGGLILGVGFLWSDLACYAVGVVLGVLVDVIGGIVPGKDRS